MPIKVAIVGANGRMGREAVKAVSQASDLELVATVSRSGVGQPVDSVVPGVEGLTGLVLESDLGAALDRTRPDVLLDLTNHEAVESNAKEALLRKISPVLGATGLSSAAIEGLNRLAVSQGVGAIYVPNFAVGAVLMMHFSEIAAKWLPDVEIIEMHHDRKADAPSGTALRTAEMIAAARTRPTTPKPDVSVKAAGALGARWPEDGNSVPIHSVRLPGLLAHQMVIFGGPGETLTIRHDSLDRAGFMEGVKLSIRRVQGLSGLVVGLDKLLLS